jgi:peptidoglycan/xylan/chitin deacetylase (PgdA/CDA1 family)
MTAGEINSQIVSTSAAIRHVTGKRVALFRPPYGAHNADVDRVVHHERMATILWNVDSRDSLGAGHKEISKRVIAGMKPGSIILMHENHGQTIRALKYKILPHLKQMNVKLVTVPQMLAGNPPTDAQLAKGRKGCAFHAS